MYCARIYSAAHWRYRDPSQDAEVVILSVAKESIDYKASGIAAYNALQLHIDKRISHGVQVGFSYTWSHANPIVPLSPNCTPKSAVTGSSDAFGTPALNADCFTVPLLAPGAMNWCDPQQRRF